MNQLCTCGLLLLCIQASLTFAEMPDNQWNLPVQITDSNTSVSFELDSTWHTVHGKTTEVHGVIESLNDKLRMKVALPVRQFDTDNGSRDERLREIMKIKDYPEVLFEAEDRIPCLPEGSRMKDCEAEIQGTLTMLNVSKPLHLAVRISYSPKEHEFNVFGKTRINWLEYGIEDPSILIARVDKAVDVLFHTRIPE